MIRFILLVLLFVVGAGIGALYVVDVPPPGGQIEKEIPNGRFLG